VSTNIFSFILKFYTNTNTMKGIQWLAIVGIVVSCYALYVEFQTSKSTAMGEKYEALCDTKIFGYHVSCSEVFESEYGRMLSHFGIVDNKSVLDQPNALIGVVFYLCTIILPYFKCLSKGNRNLIMFLASTLSCTVCVYLAYILAFVLKDFCIVCASTYVVNALVWVQSARDYCGGTATLAKVNVD